MRRPLAGWLSIPTVVALLVMLAPAPGAQAGLPPAANARAAGRPLREPFVGLLPAWAAPLSPAAPQTLPPPFLSDSNVADAPFGFAPTVDGRIAPGEYAGAGEVTFPGYAGEVQALMRQDTNTLYIALDSPDTTPFGVQGPAFQVFLDTLNDKAGSPQVDDYRLTVRRDGLLLENAGTGGGWGSLGPPSGWTAAVYTATWGWQAEIAIGFGKAGITAGSPMSIGLGLAEVWTPSWPTDWYWPSGGSWINPSTWGYLTSSSDWSSFYWKPGPWEDYAPSGLPDFDQYQVVTPTYCGPFAAANSLWWFDSKFEQNPVGPPAGGPPGTIPISDSYTLVKPYGPWDDHDPQNVTPLALDLANYFGTDTFAPGTHIYRMYDGMQRYLRDHDVWDEYIVTLVAEPDFYWIAEEVMRSEDVILLFGFWEETMDPTGQPQWVRIGGHYVTVAGVDPLASLIALSDPAQDWAETPALGRVLSGTLITHYPPHPGPSPTVHNDAGNVSHDVHLVLPGSTSPGGTWWLPEYVPPIELLSLPPGFNPNPEWEGPEEPWAGGPIHTEIEYALAVSPFTWKASGRWVEDESVPLYGRRFDPYIDFAPSGVPDFDQKQDGWGFDQGFGLGWQWTFCGPVAAANSLWWFDSKFELNGAVPPTISDTYPLVQPYGPWDDHHPLNVDDPATPWYPLGPYPPGTPGVPPGTGELIEDLAAYFGTDFPLGLGSGTVVTDLYNGLDLYLNLHNLRQGYVITQVKSPEFWWVAEEVERSEDVILLLGFYALFDPTGSPVWERVGGHYVTVSGVDKVGGFVGFSDPYWDRMEQVLPPNEFAGIPWWTGRVGSDVDPRLGPTGLVPTYTHAPLPHTGVYTLHNDAANVSHDVYYAMSTNSPGGVWGPWQYVQVSDQVTNFVGVNGPGGFVSGQPITTEVEWAVAVSPVADVWITKMVTPTVVVPGDWITFTISYGNAGNVAEDVVIADPLPAGLVNGSVVGTWNNYGASIVTHDTYSWTVGSVPWMGTGTITVTAQVDPVDSWPAEQVLTNTAVISTSSQEQYQLAPVPNSSSVVVTVQTADVTVYKSGWPAYAVPGDWVTFTIAYSNTGSAIASSTVITDDLHTRLTSPSYSYSNDYGGVLGHSGQYVWSVGDVPAGGSGLITVTARLDPLASWPDPQRVLTNTAVIATDNVERSAPPTLPNTWSITTTVWTADLSITKTVVPTDTLEQGGWVTITLLYSNAGPAPAAQTVVTDLLSSALLTSTDSIAYYASYAGSMAVSDRYVWEFGSVPAGGWGIITITSQVSATAGITFTNEALIDGWYDRDTSNNWAAVTLEIPPHTIYLPLVLRNY